MTDTDTPAPRPFALFIRGAHGVGTYPTKAAAILAARAIGAESFEVYDADDRQVFAEHPAPRWV